VIRALERALLPLVVSLNAFGNGLLGLVGIKRQRVERERYHTAEELQYIVEESEEGGLLRGESGQLLRDLFEFGDRTAGEAMVPRVLLVGIRVGAEPDELRAIVRTQAHTRYPVYSGDLDHIIGSLHIKEVLRHLISNQPVSARDARELPYVPGPTAVTEVLAAMRRYRAQMAVVMDQHGGTAGLVTMRTCSKKSSAISKKAAGAPPSSRRRTAEFVCAARSDSMKSRSHSTGLWSIQK
jgi:CBS domain containing-hemolysin-like protein